jgi:hypothetical protein
VWRRKRRRRRRRRRRIRSKGKMSWESTQDPVFLEVRGRLGVMEPPLFEGEMLQVVKGEMEILYFCTP